MLLTSAKTRFIIFHNENAALSHNNILINSEQVMGNRSSSVQPSGPPPLLSAAVLGNIKAFGESWNGEDSIGVRDAQNNNVLHALFSCRGSNIANCPELLGRIHSALSDQSFLEAYRAKNAIGCTPLWILVAYGNVDLLKVVQQTFANQNQTKVFLKLLQDPNHQGDSPLLATCSQGNVDMVRFWKEELPTEFQDAMRASNKKGTTPLQIIVGNNHVALLQYVLEENIVGISQLLESNQAGLSLFHICSERNAETILKLLLAYANDRGLEKVFLLKDKNGANPLHVAAFCGNKEVARVWIDAVDDSNDNLLDVLDGQGRTAYWLTMVQGHEEVGEMLAQKGVDTKNPKMIKEIEQARERRRKVAEKRQQQPAIDGAALLSR